MGSAEDLKILDDLQHPYALKHNLRSHGTLQFYQMGKHCAMLCAPLLHGNELNGSSATISSKPCPR